MFLLPPIMTVMRLCIMLYTYWTPLATLSAISTHCPKPAAYVMRHNCRNCILKQISKYLDEAA